MKATEKFGMFGIGWGIEPDSVKYEKNNSFRNRQAFKLYG